jgi:choline dehydrogenase-like flavoprotein
VGLIDTDYLVVGAGAAGMAFADELIAHSEADVVLVDRRDRPGGHWNDAYPFVRLHQASVNYGVNCRALGTQSIDTSGPNTGSTSERRGRRSANTSVAFSRTICFPRAGSARDGRTSPQAGWQATF